MIATSAYINHQSCYNLTGNVTVAIHLHQVRMTVDNSVSGQLSEGMNYQTDFMH